MIPVCIFAKPFIAGQVKTRLAPVLGPQPAAELAAAMFRDVWQTVSSCPGVRPVLATVQTGRNALIEFPVDLSSSDILLQGDGDLGARLEHVLRQALATAPAAIAVGAGSPLLNSTLLEQAVDAVMLHNAAIGPAHDGGFYLLGVCACPRGLFSKLPWSTPETARATKRRLEDFGFSVRELEPLLDIDTPDDLAQLSVTLRDDGPLAPATYEWQRKNGILRIS